MKELLRLSWELARLGACLHFASICIIYLVSLAALALISASNGWTDGDIAAIWLVGLTYAIICAIVLSYDPYKDD